MCKVQTMSWKSARDAALALCKGQYQRDVILGHEPISGAGLKGKAREYSASYARSRRSIQIAMAEAGIPFNIGTGEHGCRFLVFGDWSVTLIEDIEQCKRDIKRRRSQRKRDTMLLVPGEEAEHEYAVRWYNKFMRESAAVMGNLARASERIANAARKGRITPSATEMARKSIQNAERFLEWDRDNYAKPIKC